MTDETAPTPEPAPPQPETASQPDAALQAENAELKDRLLRALAEMDNLRKRAERDAKDARAYAITAFARDLLTVADNLNRALEAAQPGGDGEGAGGQSLAEGVALTARELDAVLSRNGVQRVEPMNERFDPNLHQAMLELEDPSVPTGTVVQVMQTGYTLSGRVLRPALVAVSRGGPKPGAEPSATVDKSI